MFRSLLMVASACFLVLGCLPISGFEDPTRPPGKKSTLKVASKPKLALNSIIFGEQRRLAQINGKMMSVGEMVQGIELIHVDRHSVIVKTADGKDLTLMLGLGNIRKEIK